MNIKNISLISKIVKNPWIKRAAKLLILPTLLTYGYIEIKSKFPYLDSNRITKAIDDNLDYENVVKQNTKTFYESHVTNFYNPSGKYLTLVNNVPPAEFIGSKKLVSEGLGYGAWIFGQTGDKESFKKVIQTAYDLFYINRGQEKGLFSWVLEEDGSQLNSENSKHSASDADFDILGSMIMAYEKWPELKSEIDIENKINRLIVTIAEKEIKTVGADSKKMTLLLPSGFDQWQTDKAFLAFNPSYVDLAWIDQVNRYVAKNNFPDEIKSKYKNLEKSFKQLLLTFANQKIKNLSPIKGIFPDWVYVGSADQLIYPSVRDAYSLSANQGNEAVRVYIRLIHYFKSYQKSTHTAAENQEFENFKTQITEDFEKLSEHIRFYDKQGYRFLKHFENQMKKLLRGETLTAKEAGALLSGGYYDDSLGMILEGLNRDRSKIVPDQLSKELSEMKQGVKLNSLKAKDVDSELIRPEVNQDARESWMQWQESQMRSSSDKIVKWKKPPLVHGYKLANNLFSKGYFSKSMQIYEQVLKASSDHLRKTNLSAAEKQSVYHLMENAIDDYLVNLILSGNEKNLIGVASKNSGDHWLWKIKIAELLSSSEYSPSLKSALRYGQELREGAPQFRIEDFGEYQDSWKMPDEQVKKLTNKISALTPAFSERELSRKSIPEDLHQRYTMPQIERIFLVGDLLQIISERVERGTFYDENKKLFEDLLSQSSDGALVSKIRKLVSETLSYRHLMKVRWLDEWQEGKIRDLNNALLKLYEPALEQRSQVKYTEIPQIYRDRLDFIEYRAKAGLNESVLVSVSELQKTLTDLNAKSLASKEVSTSKELITQYRFLAQKSLETARNSKEVSIVKNLNQMAIECYEKSFELIAKKLFVLSTMLEQDVPDEPKILVRQEVLDLMNEWMKSIFRHETEDSVKRKGLEGLIRFMNRLPVTKEQSAYPTAENVKKIMGSLITIDRSLLDKLPADFLNLKNKFDLHEIRMNQDVKKQTEKGVDVFKDVNQNFENRHKWIDFLYGEYDKNEDWFNYFYFDGKSLRQKNDKTFDPFKIAANWLRGRVNRVVSDTFDMDFVRKSLYQPHKLALENVSVAPAVPAEYKVYFLKNWLDFQLKAFDKERPFGYVSKPIAAPQVALDSQVPLIKGANQYLQQLNHLKDRDDLAEYYRIEPEEFYWSMKSFLNVFNDQKMNNAPLYLKLLDHFEEQIDLMAKEYFSNPKILRLKAEVKKFKALLLYVQLIDLKSSGKNDSEILKKYQETVKGFRNDYTRAAKDLTASNATYDYRDLSFQDFANFELGLDELRTRMTPQYKTVQGVFDQIRKFEDQILIRTTIEDTIQENYLKASLAFRQKNYPQAIKYLEPVEAYLAKKGMNYFYEQNNTLPGWVLILKANIMAGSRRSAESKLILDQVLKLYPNKIDQKLSGEMHANDMNMIYWLVRGQIEGFQKARQVESSVDEALRRAKGN